MPEAQFDITPPYNFRLSLRFAISCRFESGKDAGEERLGRLILISGVPLLVRIHVSRSVKQPKGVVVWSYPEGGRVSKQDILGTVRHMISADLNLLPFYEKAQSSKQFGRIVEDFRGLKPILTPTVFESAAWAIMSQQVNLTFAHTLKMRIVEKYGRRFNVDGHNLSLFPEPQILSRAKTPELRKLQFSTRKAEYLIDLANGICRGGYDLESLGDLQYDEALNKLTSIRGLGVWSANYILMRGAGHPDCLPLGDSGLHRAAQMLYNLKSIPDNEKIERLAMKFAPYRSLYTLYLWYSLMQELNES